MPEGMENVEFARENEDFADDLDLSENPSKNWVVIVRFYSYLHYVEEYLQMYNYNSRSHNDRRENIRNCPHIDNKARKIYRLLEDISRDARYECIRMTEDDVQKSKENLDEGKDVLGFSGGATNHKYST